MAVARALPRQSSRLHYSSSPGYGQSFHRGLSRGRADQPESHTWWVQRETDLPALRQAAWKPGSCPTPRAWVAQRSRPPRRPPQALPLLCRSVPHFRSALSQCPARVGVAPGRTQLLPRRTWWRRAVGMVKPQPVLSVPLPAGQSIDLSAGECPRPGRDQRRRKTRRVSERTCSVSTGPCARLLGPYCNHAIAELGDLPGFLQRRSRPFSLARYFRFNKGK